MVDHRPSSSGLQAPQLNRGANRFSSDWAVFFLNPLPEFTPRPTTCSDEVITEDSFSPSKISPWLSMLDSSIVPGAHQKLASIKWHYLHERQRPNNLSPILPFSLQSRACKKREGRKKGQKKVRNFSFFSLFFFFLRAADAIIPPV